MDTGQLAIELTRDEGLRLKPYRDSVGKLTIGIGRNLDDVGISEEEAEHLLLNDIQEVVLDLDRALPWWRTLDEVRQRVLANMAFNLGIVKLMKFPNTLRFIKDAQYEAAAEAMAASLWHRQVGPRAVRLEQMMRTGMAP